MLSICIQSALALYKTHENIAKNHPQTSMRNPYSVLQIDRIVRYYKSVTLYYKNPKCAQAVELKIHTCCKTIRRDASM